MRHEIQRNKKINKSMGNCPTLMEKFKDKVPCLLPRVQHGVESLGQLPFDLLVVVCTLRQGSIIIYYRCTKLQL